jgi:Secretion system C-terminal sorting domain
MKKILLASIALFGFLAGSSQVKYYNGLDSLDLMIAGGWMNQNHSAPIGPDSWVQGNLLNGIGAVAVAGPGLNDFIQASFTAIAPASAGTISAWLVSPTISISDMDSIRFYALSYNSFTYPDRIQCLISTAGDASVMPTDENGVGSFTNVAFIINPDLNTTDFPSVTNGDTWTRFSAAVAGIGTNVNCKVAIRYFVEGGGEAGANSSSIGIDEFYVTGPAGYVGTDETTSTPSFQIFPNPVADVLNVQLNGGTAQVHVLDQTGRVVMSTQATSNVVKMNVADLAAGVYTVSVVSSNGETMVKKFIKG